MKIKNKHSCRQATSYHKEQLEDLLDDLWDDYNSINESLRNAKQRLRSVFEHNDSIRVRAESYWLTHMRAALNNDQYGVTMEDTLKEVETRLYGEDNEE